MSLATALWSAWWGLMDKLPTSVVVANYTTGDTVTYVLSDDTTHVRLIVHHAEKRSTNESSTSIIAPNLVKMLTEGTVTANVEENIDGSMKENDALKRGVDEIYKMRKLAAENLAYKIMQDTAEKYK